MLGLRISQRLMSRSPIGAPALVLLCFAFLAGAAWTGGLVGIGWPLGNREDP